MKTTQTTKALKPTLFLKALAILVAIKGIILLSAAIYKVLTIIF